MKKICITFAPAISNESRFNGLWCNGNTTDFGSVILGSSPSRPTKKPRNFRGFFYFNAVLDFKGDYRSNSVVYQIFANASIEEVG